MLFIILFNIITNFSAFISIFLLVCYSNIFLGSKLYYISRTDFFLDFSELKLSN